MSSGAKWDSPSKQGNRSTASVGTCMRQLAFRLFSTVFLVLALCEHASATSSLSFEGGGYWIDLEVGYTEQPVIAAVRFFCAGRPERRCAAQRPCRS